MIRAFVILLFLGAMAFGAGFYATETVQAHGTHCQGYQSLGCNFYYSSQWRCCASGIKGRIKAENVVMSAPNTLDAISHWVGITSITFTAEFARMGFWEGFNPDGNSPASPELFTYVMRTSCGNAEIFISHGTAGGLWDDMFVSFTGDYYVCSTTPSVIQYRFNLKDGASGQLLATGYMGAPYGLYDAESEHFNQHAIEPNATQCFGTNSSCSASTAYGLRVCCSAGGQWDLWTATPSYRVDYPYNQVIKASNYSFYTYGGP